jgi:cysteinyl-tRNA synthetase
MDLCFPHHENEMAQAEAATGHVFARHWFHVAHLCVGGEKMAKSLGNLFTLHDILAMGYSPMALRYALLCGHYRQPLNFTIPSLRSAERALERLRHRGALLRERAGNGKCRADGFRIFAPSWQCLLRDLHTPDALGQLFLHLQRSDVAHMGKEEAEREWAEWQRLMEVLGLDLEPNPPSPVPDAIGRIAEERLAARAGKDYAKADELRREMESEGWTVRDTANGYALEKFANHTE